MAGLRDVEERTRAYRAGQLHAAVAALQNLAGFGGNRLMSPGYVSLAAETPGKKIREELFEAGHYLIKAGERSPARGVAAGEIFEALPGLLRACGGRLIDRLDAADRPDFKDGCRDQFAVYRESHGAVVG